MLLSVNMQTSFMHPPFGFALFYLRSVAPKEVKTSDIYWGAVPFVAIQVIMVTLIIAFPSIVSVGAKTDMKEQIELKIDMSSGTESSGDTGTATVDFSPGSDNKDGGELKLDFSTEPEKK